jgi:hypothetical protein
MIPHFPEVVGKCIGVWTFAENEMGNLFGVLLETKSPATLEVFLNLRRSSSQRDAINAAAKHALTDTREIEVFDAIMVLYKALESDRNDLAHGCFGFCPTDSSILFWIDIKDYVHFLVDVVPRLIDGTHGPDPHEMLKRKMFVYRMSDLNRILDEMDKFQTNVAQFTSYLRNRSQPGLAQVFERLYIEPQILRERTR